MKKSRMYVFLVLLFFSFAVEAKEIICLNMIVRNESEVIKRCLDSVIPIIDYWVIVDTGSTDGTQEIIKDYLKDIPGELYERPWRNFGDNRMEALELAKGMADYILFMDADDVLEYDDNFSSTLLTKDQYQMWRGNKSFTYKTPQLVKSNLPWKWVGVVHEYLACDVPYTFETLENVRYISIGDGGSSSDPMKFWKYIKLLKEGLKREPFNSRYVFYLAQSYLGAGEKEQALKWYQKRISMCGWDEEVFWSMLQRSILLAEIGLPEEVVAASIEETHAFRPHRLEPLYLLAAIYLGKEEYARAYDIITSKDNLSIPSEKDVHFNISWIGDYGLLFQLSICSYYIGNYQESLDACDKLLSMEDLPEPMRRQTETNRTFPLAKLVSLSSIYE